MNSLLLFMTLLGAPAASAAAISSRSMTLTVCDDVQDPMTLDPHKEFSEKNHTLLQQIYEGLVRFDSEGRIEPALALSWETVDPLRVRFHLRSGVRFHDGEAFDADSVRFSISRYLDPKTGFPALGFIASLDRAEVVDSRTVDIVTKYPDGLLLNRLAGFILIVAPGHVARGGDGILNERPVGTGPFKFERWERGSAVHLKANGDYWRPGFPKAERLVFKFIPEKKQTAALISGEIDLLTELPGARTTELIQTGLVDIVKRPSFYTVTGSLNASRGPLADVRVRRALNHAIDKHELIRYDLLGNGRILATTTMDQEEGHNAELKPFLYDPKKAKKLLSEAGYSKGFKLKVAVKKQGERAAGILAHQLRRVGVELETRVFPDAELPRVLASERWDMFLAGCPDPMSHSYFIHSIFLFSQSPYRVSINEEYDRRLTAMAGTLDPLKRVMLARALDAYVQEEALLIFLYQRVKTYGVRKGIVFHPTITGMPYFSDVGMGSAP